MQKNYGFIKDEIVPEDFHFGGERSIKNKFGALLLQTNIDWREFLFNGIYSHQAPGFETNSCVSHGTANALELLRRRQYGYDQDLSDRFIAKGSGTDPSRGNTPKTVAEFVRKNFTVFEQEWATLDATSVEDFYRDIPQNLKTLATARGAEWDFAYEYVPLTLTALREALKYSPLGISVPAWFQKDGEYYRPDGVPDSHWVCLMHIDDLGRMYILDSYDPTTKIMSAGFMPQVAMKYHLNRQVVNQDWFTAFLTWIHSWIFVSPEKPTPLPEKANEKAVENKVEPKPVKVSQLDNWCDAIEFFESGGDKNAASYRRNNPGNVKGLDGKFLDFPTYEAGRAYLMNYLTRAATNRHEAYVRRAAQLKKNSSGMLTIREFIEVYTFGDSAEIQTNYAACIARYCNCAPETEIRNLL
jgi:hypothetical protein